MSKISERFRQEIVFFFILALVILFRILILNRFAFMIYDSDQSIMWNAAIDYSHGIFHEPRFYGQAYNTNLEALLAVPLIWLSVPVTHALPIITTILTVLPFLFIALIARSRGKFMEACLVLSIPLLLPVEYGFLTSMPRGFVTGIFVSSIGAAMIYSPLSAKSWFITGLTAILGYSVNPNSLLISVPVLFYIWLYNREKGRYYSITAAGMLIGIILDRLAALFYTLHPGYVMHQAPGLRLSEDLFLSAIGNFNKYLGNVTPVFGTTGVMALVILLVIAALFFFMRKKREGLTVILSLLLILASLATSKAEDGMESIFFSWSRMFLAVPVLIALFIPFLDIPFRRYGFILFIITLGFFFGRNEEIRPAFQRESILGQSSVVSIASSGVFTMKCEQVRTFARIQKVSLVIEKEDYFYDFINYGCPACYPDFPATLRPSHERRTWRLQEEMDKVHENIMVIDFSYETGRELKKLRESGAWYFNINGFYFIKGNKMPTGQLLKTLSLDVRKF